MLKRLAALLCLFTLATLAAFAADARRVPTIDDLLTIKSVGGTQISPDGKWVAYTVGYGDFKTDAFVTQIWLAQSDTGKSFQLTRGDKSATNPRWSPDGQWLAFLSNRIEDKNQIFVINPLGGEAQPLTKSETAISNFAWSEDGKTIAYTAAEPIAQALKDRKDYLSDDSVKKIVSQPGPDNNPRFSPDGKQIVFSSAMGEKLFFASNSRLAVVEVDGGTPRSITDMFDENPGLVEWKADGIYFTGLQKTASHLFRVDPATGRITRVS